MGLNHHRHTPLQQSTRILPLLLISKRVLSGHCALELQTHCFVMRHSRRVSLTPCVYYCCRNRPPSVHWTVSSGASVPKSQPSVRFLVFEAVRQDDVTTVWILLHYDTLLLGHVNKCNNEVVNIANKWLRIQQPLKLLVQCLSFSGIFLLFTKPYLLARYE